MSSIKKVLKHDKKKVDAGIAKGWQEDRERIFGGMSDDIMQEYEKKFKIYESQHPDGAVITYNNVVKNVKAWLFGAYPKYSTRDQIEMLKRLRKKEYVLSAIQAEIDRLEAEGGKQ